MFGKNFKYIIRFSFFFSQVVRLAPNFLRRLKEAMPQIIDLFFGIISPAPYANLLLFFSGKKNSVFCHLHVNNLNESVKRNEQNRTNLSELAIFFAFKVYFQVK